MGRHGYVSVSIKVRRELEEKTEGLGIKISEVLRKVLEEEVRRRELGSSPGG